MINKNIRGWVARDYIIATIIFSAVIALFVIMTGSISYDYENEKVINQTFSSSFDKFDNDTARVTAMWDILNSEGGLKLADAVELLFSGTTAVITLMFGAVKSSATQIWNLGTFLGLPKEISNIILGLIVSAITVIIIFVVINSVRGGKEL